MIKELYIQATSPIHSLNFWVKFLVFLLFLPLASFLAKPSFLVVLVIAFLLLVYSSKIGLGKFWNLTKLYIIGISFGVIILSLFFSPGDLNNKLFLGLVLAVRFILLISFGMLFATITNPIEIPTGFLQAKIPHKYGVTLMVGYRMMPLLARKIQSVIEAQRARGAQIELSFSGLPKLTLVSAALLVPILHSTLETSVRLSDTLISRGYDPDGKITTPPFKLMFGDWLIFVSGILTLAASVLLK